MSTQELNALLDVKFFELKQSVMDKATHLLSSLELNLKEETGFHRAHIPNGVLDVDSKISKGENYRGLPYLVLDYPRYFKNENIFAFRSMFWWGNYFTFTLHLSGMHLEHYLPKLKTNLNKLELRNTYISIGENPWVHHVDNSHYLTVQEWRNSVDEKAYFENAKYIKLVRKLDINNWDQAAAFGLESYKLFLNTIS
ncbi:MAG: hypothetical protein HKN75_11175 [Bacteroidia bacterium]|nr:hypothetical protein [Bacteroidia bacterium]